MGLPAGGLTLNRDEIHVWLAFLDQPDYRVRRLEQLLSKDERMRAESFCFERDRKSFIVGRGLLRTILGRYLRIEPSRLQFSFTSNGKPVLGKTFGGGSMLRFNLSHSQGLALYAVTCGREIGIDLEYIHPISDVEQIAAHFFSVRENTVLRALPAHRRLEAFFNCWTRKEAYLKAIGDGLTQPLVKFDVTLTPGEPARLLHVDGDPQEVSRWSLQELTPASGYAATLAVEGHDWHLVCRQWVDDYCQ